MITKPEDACFVAAVTRDDLLKQSFGGSAEVQLFIAQANVQPMFTAKQCAEIANAYGEECAKSAQGYKNRQKAWEAKFKE